MSNALISLCMIVKNEEDVILRCLESVKDAVDEMIVVDTGSTDRTVELAASAGAQVYPREWRSDFAAARNESIELATGRWILVLDADETLEENHGAQLRELVSAMPDIDGFFVQIVNYIGTEAKRIGSSTSSSMRLFRNMPGYRYEGRIHEQIVQPIINANPAARLHYSSLQLNHGGYLPEVVQKKNKVQRNMELLEQELAHTDNESFHRYNLGIEYMRAGKHTLALEEFRRSKTVADWRVTSFGHVVVLREANCLQALGQWEEAAQLCQSAAEDLHDYPDLFLTLGRIYYHLHQWETAAEAFHKALNIGVSPPKYTSTAGAGTYNASFYLGKTREQLQDYEGAITCYANAMKFNPGLLSPFLRLIGLLSRTGNSARITSKLEQLFHLESPKTWWSIALSYYQLGLYEQAAEVLRKKALPAGKLKDQTLLLLRCRLLAPDAIKGPRQKETIASRRLLVRRSYYQALASNDENTASRWLTRMEEEHKRNSAEAASAGREPDYAAELLLNLHANLLYGQEQHPVPLHLPAIAYTALWSELSFLYMLAASKHMFTLQSQVQAYWRHLLNNLPDPVLRLKGRYELVKTVHVRVYHILGREADSGEYAALWNNVKPRLMTLIDDLLMEEVT
jgi:tetratricopeptide (TPR) repeat protein